MHSAPSHTDNRQNPIARFGHSHGYRLDGDSALLNAQIDVGPSGALSAQSFALQLWACDEPYRGGPLSGFKIAEAPIALSEIELASRHDAVAFARPPASASCSPAEAETAPRDYSMVLVLAAGTHGSFDQVYDFANYPERQRFIVPHLAGAAAYKLHDDGSVSMKVERVVNPRADDNLSGTLSLQLWAREAPYSGGELTGTLLSAYELGQVRGQDFSAPGELRCPLAEPKPNATHVVLALCEWTSAGYLARDYCNFVEPIRAAVRESTPVAKLSAPSVAPVSAPVAKPSVPSVASVSAPVAKPSAPTVAPVSAPVAKPSVPSIASVSAPLAKPSVPSIASVSAPAVSTPVVPSAAAASAPALAHSLNTISEDDLVAVAGISKKLATQVIKARPFKSFDELRGLRGIGDSTVQKLRKMFVL